MGGKKYNKKEDVLWWSEAGGRYFMSNDVRECVFLREALEDAQDEEKVIAIAAKCGCGSECTLEDGCVLYKGHYEKPDEERSFYQRLRSEFVGHMLGE